MADADQPSRVGAELIDRLPNPLRRGLLGLDAAQVYALDAVKLDVEAAGTRNVGIRRWAPGKGTAEGVGIAQTLAEQGGEERYIIPAGRPAAAAGWRCPCSRRLRLSSSTSSSSSSSSRVVMSVDDDVVEVEDDVPVSDSEGTHDMERTRPVETSQVEVLESEDGSSLPGEEESVQETGADFHDSANNRPGDGSYEQVNAATELDDALGEENSMPGSEHGSVSESSDIDENSENDDRGWDEDVTDYDDVSAAEEESSPREYRDIDDAVENDIENEELLVDQEAEDDISKDEASSAADHEQYESDVAAVPASECQIEEEDVTDVSAATVDSNEAESEMYQEPVNNDATPKKKKKKSKAKRRRRKKKKGARKTKNSDVPVAQNLTDDETSLSMHAAGARTTKNIALTASRRIVYYCVVIAIISSIKIALAALMKWVVE
mmetsp:Transcript_10907/g.22237  ORF Transcript_10907/g.22237 Transcript_10907/m.22237 type:complete len:436 (-) Transcript_10907:107-1414(-)